MNLELLDTFGQHYPEESSGVLECGIIICCRFNRWGSLLACGCNDGRVAVFDFITRQLAKVIQTHAQPIAAISWSRNGRRLATASTDHTVSVCTVLNGELRHRFRFPSMVNVVHFNPVDDSKLLVCCLKYAPVIVNIADGSSQQLTAPDDEPNETHTVACYERHGKYVLTASTRGRVNVYDANDVSTLVASLRLQSAHATRTLEYSRHVDYFMTITADRVVRVYDMNEVLVRGVNSVSEPVQKLQDMVNKTPWRACCMSGNGDYVCAASARAVALYIWERNTGALVKILHGAKGETLQDVQWHPARPVICSVSNGQVHIWAQSHVENWSAFAPDFKELEENVVYEERESEFDHEDEDKSVKADDNAHNDDCVDVDIVTVDDDNSSDAEFAQHSADDDKPLYYLPIAPDMEHADDVSLTDNADEILLSPRRGNRPKTIDIQLQRPPSAADNSAASTMSPPAQRKRAPPTANAARSTGAVSKPRR